MRLLAILALVCVAACARKGDPQPPEGAFEDDRPRVIAPSQVNDPIRRGRRL
ncbi:MAG: hypothetical protein AAGI51_13255 [Pseudomonadota bacterium]